MLLNNFQFFNKIVFERDFIHLSFIFESISQNSAGAKTIAFTSVATSDALMKSILVVRAQPSLAI